jgi:two-component system, cell cycle sensor histidine kinase and response regulator CckA
MTNRAAALTRQLLVFSRKQIVQFQSVDLNSLIKQLEKMLIRLIGDHVKIVTNLAPNLSSISANPSQLEQVVLNLVVNARDALPKGGAITIETSNVFLDDAFINTHLSVKRGPYVLLSVTDDGIGMDAETKNKIFEPFFTTKEVGKGTGLGLSTTYGIIKNSKGTIWVYSELGKGTVFKIYLPISDAVDEIQSVVQKTTTPKSGRETILLAEDDENLRNGFHTALLESGYTVLIASNGSEALEISKMHIDPIHLLLTDILMPGLNGIELAKQVMVMRKDIQVLYMSGYTSDTLENSGIENLRASQFLQKPFGTSFLLDKVHEALLLHNQ